MLDGRVILVQQAYYDELRRQARCERQIREAGAPGARPLCRALAWLGRRLMIWGAGLQQRYGDRADAAGLRGARASI